MFMAPEVARAEEQGCPCDIWALGCTVIEMATGASPWPNVVDPVSVLYRIAYSGETPEIPGFLSEQGKDFLGKCLKRNPKDRWTATQLLKHPFLEEFNSSGAKEIQESNPTSSPTSILDQGFWNCLEESESFGNMRHASFENSSADRIRRLAACSGEPSWRCDEDWMLTRGNEAEDGIEAGSFSGSQTPSTSTTGSKQELEKSNVKNINGGGCSSYFCDDNNSREVSVVISDFNSGRSFGQLLPSVSNFL
ncbi:hypothetical protein L6164_018859 [Bauhinia variegata]|nr:hypothetical protein L6164_018859 [Bauhinia variegata]